MPSLVLSFAVALGFATTAAVPTGVRRVPFEEQAVGVAPSGEIHDAEFEDAVRRQNRKPTTGISYDDNVFRADSVLAGMAEMVEFREHVNVSCSSGHGGAELDMDSPAPTRLTLTECKKRCMKDDRCTCVSFDTSTGKCSTQKYCVPEACHKSSLISSYEMVANYTIGGVTYRRAGGWDCSSSGLSQAEDIDVQPAVNVTPTQCLQRCNSDTQCTCVRYSRYYSMQCWTRKGCPTLGKDLQKCERSDRFDTYIRQ